MKIPLNLIHSLGENQKIGYSKTLCVCIKISNQTFFQMSSYYTHFSISSFSCLLKDVCSSSLIRGTSIWGSMTQRETPSLWRQKELGSSELYIYLFSSAWLPTRNSAMWNLSFLLCKIRTSLILTMCENPLTDNRRVVNRRPFLPCP